MSAHERMSYHAEDDSRCWTCDPLVSPGSFVSAAAGLASSGRVRGSMLMRMRWVVMPRCRLALVRNGGGGGVRFQGELSELGRSAKIKVHEKVAEYPFNSQYQVFSVECMWKVYDSRKVHLKCPPQDPNPNNPK